MRTRRRRTTLVWLIITGLLLTIILISSAVAPQIQALAAGVYIVAALAVLGIFSPEIIRQHLPSRPLLNRRSDKRQSRATRISKAAQRAQERASHLPNYQARFDLVDVGLVASDVRADGLHLKRGNISLDDQAAQPYIVLKAESAWANEKVVVRFELLDPAGETQFICEDEVYLRDGRNVAISSHRLPLRDKIGGGQPGLWELRVAVDGSTIALHSFGVKPSLQERQRLFAEEDGDRRARLSEAFDDEDAPVSLEELLRGQQQGEDG